MEITQEIRDFIDHKIEVSNFYLPHFYPESSSLRAIEDFQNGYKTNANTGKKVTKGGFLEEWLVICTAYQADPFFINIKEKEKGFPVYFAWHGTGEWSPVKVSGSIVEFEKQLKLLKRESDIKPVLKKEFDLSSVFWKSVYEEAEDAAPTEEVEADKIDFEEIELKREIGRLCHELRKLNEDRYAKRIDLKTFYHMKKEKEGEIKNLRGEIEKYS